MPQVLTDEQVANYWRDGYVVLRDALSPPQLEALQADFEIWKEASRNQPAPYGKTIDGRARFDLEPGHSETHPALRRIASPVEESDSYLDAMRNARAVDAVAQLVGPNVEFNNSKINSKQPGASTHVRFHQDFSFQPHSNEDLVAVLYFLDDVTLENGPLAVVPGSHKGTLHEHWQGGQFTGAVGREIAEQAKAEAIPCTGPAGTACLMHTRLLHGSAANRSDAPRTLFIAEYRSEDSKPLDVSHLPSVYEGELVRGQRTGRLRCSSYEMAFPEVPKGASFFDQQAKVDP